MPSCLTPMVVSKNVREELGKDEELKDFVDVLGKNSTYMELGSLGTDPPYYESMARSAANLLLDRFDKPLGIEQWSTQKTQTSFP